MKYLLCSYWPVLYKLSIPDRDGVLQFAAIANSKHFEFIYASEGNIVNNKAKTLLAFYFEKYLPYLNISNIASFDLKIGNTVIPKSLYLLPVAQFDAIVETPFFKENEVGPAGLETGIIEVNGSKIPTTEGDMDMDIWKNRRKAWRLR